MRNMKLCSLAVLLATLSVQILFAQNDQSDNSIGDMRSQPDFQATIAAPYTWNSAQRQTFQSILGQPRFSNQLSQTPLLLNNIDQLRMLKDLLDILPSVSTLTNGMKEYCCVGIDPCMNHTGPPNIEQRYDDVHIGYRLSPLSVLYSGSGAPLAAFDVMINNLCPPSDYTAFFVSPRGTIGFGTNAPQAQYHFVKADLQVGDASQLQFRINNTTHSMTLSNAGTDLFKVSTSGTFARKIKVTMGTFPDYVFADDYKLRPLSEVDSYICENRHLPGIRSAAEYAKDEGVDIGELQGKLLEKVEELTLYVIQQQKEIARQQTEIDALKKQQK